MSDEKKQELEKIFRESSSSTELFDAFRIAISNKIPDPDLYKTLLWNKALSADEISMYAEKITKEFPENSYNIFLWAGQIFGASSVFGEYHENAVKYFKKAAHINESTAEPYLLLAGTYNKELNIPPFEDVISILQDGIEKIEEKSRLCFIISELYMQQENIENSRRYRRLGEKYQKDKS
jgi:tetratricopeptide (TPR) repeat protein